MNDLKCNGQGLNTRTSLSDFSRGLATGGEARISCAVLILSRQRFTASLCLSLGLEEGNPVVEQAVDCIPPRATACVNDGQPARGVTAMSLGQWSLAVCRSLWSGTVV